MVIFTFDFNNSISICPELFLELVVPEEKLIIAPLPDSNISKKPDQNEKFDRSVQSSSCTPPPATVPRAADPVAPSLETAMYAP
jgi:hypothetical protein